MGVENFTVLKLLGNMIYETIRFDMTEVERSYHDVESDYLGHGWIQGQDWPKNIC